MTNRCLILLFVLFCVFTSSYGLTINEVMQSNINGIMDDLNEFPDSWVELYNEDSVPVNIHGYQISLSPKVEEAYCIEDSSMIEQGGYYLIYCDKEGKGRHTNFRLNSDDSGSLYLFDREGVLLDVLDIPEMPAPNISYGKVIGETDYWSYFRTATPELPNEGIYSNRVLYKPDFSVNGGVYKEPFYLSIKVDDRDDDIPNVKVRYTIDGSEPTDSSMEFKDSIMINKTMVIRAKTFSDSLVSKPSKTQSYLFFDREVTLPIISVVTDSSYLYDDEIGIYVKGKYAESHPNAKSSVPTVGNYNYCFNWRRPANFEFFNSSNGDCELNQLCEFRMGGNSSRTVKIKSFVFYANKRFGTKRFSYDFWPWKNGEDKSKSFYLRNAGADWYHAHIRDALVQLSFGKYVDWDWLGYQPAILMINGNYGGILNIRERAHEDYIWKNYNKLENVDLIEYTSGHAKCGDLNDYEEFKSVYTSSESTYQDLDKYMDINEFLNYFVANSLYSNNDFPGNNYRLWKEKKEGAKWRWFAYDMDQTCGLSPSKEIYRYDFRYLNYILREAPFYDNGYSNTPSVCVIFKKMMSLPEFRNQFIDRISVYMGTFASPRSMNALIDSLVYNVEYEMPFYYDKIKRDFNEYYSEIDRLKEWVSLRVPFVYQDTKEFFSLGDTVSLQIATSFQEPMTFNDVNVIGNEFQGYYYKGRNIKLTQPVSEEGNVWVLSYSVGDSTEIHCFPNEENISFEIPDSVSSVRVEHLPYEKTENNDATGNLDLLMDDEFLTEGASVDLFTIDGKFFSHVSCRNDLAGLPSNLYLIVRKGKNGILSKKIIHKAN